MTIKKYEPWKELELLKSCYPQNDEEKEKKQNPASIIVKDGDRPEDRTPRELWGHHIFSDEDED